jgi:uracil-DNA glycosylase
MVEARVDRSYESWHAQARALLLAGTRPDEVVWTDTASSQPLLEELTEPSAENAKAPSPSSAGVPVPSPVAARITVPRQFVELAKLAIRHSSSSRMPLLYRVLWRLVHENRRLLDLEIDDDVRELRTLVRQVREDAERMKAFVRLRRVGLYGGRFVAWHRPDHDAAPLVAQHFAERYPQLAWSILTPLSSVHFDAGQIVHGPGMPADAMPKDDSDRAAEELWRAYYTAAFNPARANERKLSRDMPARFRATLPESPLIPSLLAAAGSRTEQMRAASGGATARAVVPETRDLGALREAARSCRACPLYANATATVFGEGPADADLVLVGEQPGDVEDRRGRPFVGPAGELLDRALAAAGIDRTRVYVTNAVKHFAWEPRGKRRIHRTPTFSEIRACRPWLESELAALAPRVIVCLGGTAAQTLLGPQARVNALRGRVIAGQSFAPAVVVTLHPSAVLRTEPSAQDAAFASLVADLQVARGTLLTGDPHRSHASAR